MVTYIPCHTHTHSIDGKIPLHIQPSDRAIDADDDDICTDSTVYSSHSVHNGIYCSIDYIFRNVTWLIWCSHYGKFIQSNDVCARYGCTVDDRRTHIAHITSTLSIRSHSLPVSLDARSKTYPSLILRTVHILGICRTSYAYSNAFIFAVVTYGCHITIV